MTILQLRNHIPISGPARREPADGSETAMRVSLGFEPAGLLKAVGRKFEQDLDCVYLLKSLRKP